MTEAQYLASTDPAVLLDYVRDRTTERKLRLFMAACCREVWHLVDDPRSRVAIVVAERYADGAASDAERQAAWAAAQAAAQDAAYAAHAAQTAAYSARDAAHTAARDVVWHSARDAMVGVAMDAARAAVRAAVSATAPAAAQAAVRAAARAAAKAQQAALLRCVLGNPWRSAPRTADRCYLEQTARPLARGIYDARDWEALPILADALEEAGCANTDVLAHLRGPGPHCRGCWCMDLVLGLS